MGGMAPGRPVEGVGGGGGRLAAAPPPAQTRRRFPPTRDVRWETGHPIVSSQHTRPARHAQSARSGPGSGTRAGPGGLGGAQGLPLPQALGGLRHSAWTDGRDGPGGTPATSLGDGSGSRKQARQRWQNSPEGSFVRKSHSMPPMLFCLCFPFVYSLSVALHAGGAHFYHKLLPMKSTKIKLKFIYKN